MWGIFRKHHYLSSDFNKSADTYIIKWEDSIVGLFSVLTMPNGSYKYAYRVHRMVILPDYQGLGIGTKILDWFGDYYYKQGKKLFIRSTHVRLHKHCSKSNKWLESTNSNKTASKLTGNQGNKYKNTFLNRPAYSFEYVSEDYYNKPRKLFYIEDDINDKVLLKLVEKYHVTVLTGKPKCNNLIEEKCFKYGIRTQQLYLNVKGELVKKNVEDYDVVNYDDFTFEELVDML